MPQIDPKYDRLQLTDKYLTDPLLMALAWKKSHDYIRNINWYADNFELDKSALNLAQRCKEWAAEINSKEVSLSDLKLVPAPKSVAWTFIPNKCPTEINEILDIIFDEPRNVCYCLTWTPEIDPETGKHAELKLRPLAHIGIKEQTMMTLVMMCLANEVEAIQGDPSTQYDEVHKNKVVSYGNRLYCKYQENDEGEITAEHNYGATTIYSKYFADYRQFIQRPYFFASKALLGKDPDEEVYLVDLDLRQFYDRIDREKLIKKIKELTLKNQQTVIDPNATVDALLDAFHDWSWSPCAKDSYAVCKTDGENGISKAPNGLPQGLVSSGFLSNIYMLDFDEKMQISIESEVSESIKLVDYGRYVDDMRLVVIGPRRSKDIKNPIKTIQQEINAWIIPILAELNLYLNKEKTKVEVYRGKSKGISSTLETIQSNMSGPQSMESADEMVTQLESLLMLSDGNVPDQDGQNCTPNGLAAIEKSVFDVREDTLKRFAANKISKVLNNKRHFTSRDIDDNGNPVAGEWDYLQERMSRRFIANWSHDPALVLLLKKGLELFPSPKVLNPVLDQLKDVLKREGGIEEEKQVAVARYCLSEIFRHSAIVIHRKDPQAIPAHADVEGYFELLQNTAAAAISGSLGVKPKSSDEFDLLGEQARFLLLVRLDTTLGKSCGDPEQDLIFKLVQGYRNISLRKLIDKIHGAKRFKKKQEVLTSCILISAQLLADQKPVIRAACCLFDKLPISTPSILKKISAQNPDLMRAIYFHARSMKYAWYSRDKEFINDIAERLYLNVRPSAKPLKEITTPTGIYQLCSRADNPFANEVMALKLFQALLEKLPEFDFKDSKVIDLSRTKVQTTGYKVPPAFSAFDHDIKIVKIDEDKTHAAVVDMASHLTDLEEEPMQLQRVALAMRAVLAGSADPTGFGQSFTPRAGYRGVKSTSFKRQFGMMTTPESLAGEAAQFSSWLSTLLAKLLRWPGIHVNDQGFDWPRELTKAAVTDLINNRLKELKASYCQLSEMPVLPELITPDWEYGKKSLTVVMVQSKLPFKADFGKAGTLLDTPDYRAKHRCHVARVAELVVKHIDAQSIEVDKKQEVDLIVWPELAVHKDDLDILIHLSRKTHAIVLAGLGFINQPGVPGPNNCAIWIVPRKHNGNQNELKRFQGKHHMMAGERDLKVQPWRPYQLMLELRHPEFPDKPGFKLTSATCFDATDIKLSADLRDKSSALCIPALNQDVNSFDTMVEALHYHMYQPVILVNTGEFGSSYAMAPYDKPYKRLIAHSSGNNQVAINIFEMNMFDFRRDGVGRAMTSGLDTKTPPAGIPANDKK